MNEAPYPRSSTASTPPLQGKKCLEVAGAPRPSDDSPVDRPLRILHVGTERTWRGGENQAFALAAGLSKLGQTCLVASPPDSPLAHRAREADLEVLELNARGEADLGAISFLRETCKTRDIDILHGHTAHAHSLVALAGRGGVAARVVSRRVDFAPRKGLLGLGRLKYRMGVDRYVAISKAIKDVLVGSGVDPDRVSVVPSGVDPDRCSGANGKSLRKDLGLGPGPIVGSIAALAWHKGLEHLVEATAKMIESRPDIQVVILGEGEERPALQAAISRLGLKDNVHLPGFLDRVPEFLNLVDVYTAPSVMEGLNTSLADALAAKCPAVASSVGGIPELVIHEQTGLLVPPADPTALANAIVQLLDDPSQAKALGKAGRDHVRVGFSVDAMVGGNLDVYRSLIT